MNKQFSDLFDKAVKEQCLADKTNLELVDNTHLILGRFAELIVRECAKIVDQYISDCGEIGVLPDYVLNEPFGIK